jgi:hypothetical protein
VKLKEVVFTKDPVKPFQDLDYSKMAYGEESKGTHLVLLKISHLPLQAISRTEPTTRRFAPYLTPSVPYVVPPLIL